MAFAAPLAILPSTPALWLILAGLAGYGGATFIGDVRALFGGGRDDGSAFSVSLPFALTAVGVGLVVLSLTRR